MSTKFEPDWSDAYLAGAKTFAIRSARTGETYRVFIRIPVEIPPAEGFSTLWMLDGNASFPLTYGQRPSVTVSDQLPGKDKSAVGVVVGVGFCGDDPFDVAARARNYTPSPDALTGDTTSSDFGRATDFLYFLVEELRPAIMKQVRLDLTKQTLFGFSYGGLFTINTLLCHPGHFQRYWAASPSLWFSDELLMRKLRESPTLTSVERLKITVGNDEQYSTVPLGEARQRHLDNRAMVDNIREAADLMRTRNPTCSVDLVVAKDHDHFDMLLHGARRVPAFAFLQ